jgi:hypothetical protein
MNPTRCEVRGFAHVCLRRLVRISGRYKNPDRPVPRMFLPGPPIYLRFQPGRSSKYLDNPIEQDRRSIEPRFGTMLGIKQFRHASIRGYRTSRTGNNRFVVAVEGQLHAMDFDSTPCRVTANRNENATRRLSKLHPGRPSFGSR